MERPNSFLKAALIALLLFLFFPLREAMAAHVSLPLSSMTVDKTIIRANGVDAVKVTVTLRSPGNLPVPGDSVTVATSRGSPVDQISPSATQSTDANGQAVFFVRSQDFTTGGGSSIITAVEVADALALPSIPVTFIQPSPASISLTASPSSIPADGSSTATVTATVRDADNVPVRDGTAVSFSATAGTLSTTSTATSGGQAQTVLTSGTTVETASVSATSGAAASSTQITFTLPGPLSAPHLILPQNGTEVNFPIQFLWDQVRGAMQYKLFLSDRLDAINNPLFSTITVGETATSFTLTPEEIPPVFAADTHYYWQVQAIDRYSQPGTPSEIYSFQLEPGAQQSLTHDLAVTRITPLPNPTRLNQPTVVQLEIKNLGGFSENNVPVELFASGTSVDVQLIPVIPPRETQILIFQWTPSRPGSFELSALIKLRDSNPLNDLLATRIMVEQMGIPARLDLDILPKGPDHVFSGHPFNFVIQLRDEIHRGVGGATVAIQDGLQGDPPLNASVMTDEQGHASYQTTAGQFPGEEVRRSITFVAEKDGVRSQTVEVTVEIKEKPGHSPQSQGSQLGQGSFSLLKEWIKQGYPLLQAYQSSGFTPSLKSALQAFLSDPSRISIHAMLPGASPAAALTFLLYFQERKGTASTEKVMEFARGSQPSDALVALDGSRTLAELDRHWKAYLASEWQNSLLINVYVQTE